MQTLQLVQDYFLLALGLAALAMEIFALVDSLRYSTQAYPAAGKLTKPGWVAILVVATMIGVISISNVFSVGVLGVIAAGVYLADVRPALRAITPRKRRGGAFGQGPYGSW